MLLPLTLVDVVLLEIKLLKSVRRFPLPRLSLEGACLRLAPPIVLEIYA